MNYKISVVIPTYNSEKFIKTTIKSLEEQIIGFENIELFLIDDFSNDNTVNIINSYSNKFENIKSIQLNEKAGAPGTARNIGIKKASGEFIMFMDHDDYYPKEALEILYNKIKTTNSEVVIGRYKTFGAVEQYLDSWVSEEIRINSLNENTNFITINNIWRMIFPVKFLREKEIKFPEKMFAEDLGFMIESFLKSDKITFIPDIVYCFRIGSGDNASTSHSQSTHYIQGLLNGYYYTRNILKNNNGCEYYDLLFSMHLASWIDNIVKSDLDENEKYNLIKNSLPLFTDLNNIILDINPDFENFRIVMEKLRDNKLDEAFENLKKNSLNYQNKIKHKLKNVLKRILKK